jgi:hypothetical protein
MIHRVMLAQRIFSLKPHVQPRVEVKKIAGICANK